MAHVPVPGQVDVDRLRQTVGGFADGVIELPGDCRRTPLEEANMHRSPRSHPIVEG
ncbi:hypothetical protein WEH80_23650 [Actinomycetes bacterium KLBMP 9759]